MHGIIFAYGQCPALKTLVEHRVADSTPYAARYRMIDFMLSNMVNAGVKDVGVVLQDKYQSMLDHLGSGKDWDLSRKHGGLRLLPAAPKSSYATELRGKMEALAAIESYVQRIRQDYVALANGALICNLDLSAVLDEHIRSGADITCVCTAKHVAAEGVTFSVAPDGTITDVFSRTPVEGSYASLEVYILSKNLLEKLIAECDGRNLYSFHRSVLQDGLGKLKLHAYVFEGYAARVISLQDYYERSMELLRADVRADLFAPERPIRTKDRSDASTYYGPEGRCVNSLVSDGCIIEGEVENSIIFRGVHVEKGAKISDCIVMQDTIIRAGATLRYAIADKNVTVNENRMLMGHSNYPLAISKFSVV
jgi:glucose-1-phosphate adenylyltransferase